MDARKLAQLCQKLADNKKAENLIILDRRKLSSVADYFVLATGTSEPHLRAISDEIQEKVHEEVGEWPRAVDGQRPTNWQVLDYTDVIVHVMRAEVRERYDLEGLWSDAPRVRARAPRKPAAPKAPKAIKPAKAK